MGVSSISQLVSECLWERPVNVQVWTRSKTTAILWKVYIEIACTYHQVLYMSLCENKMLILHTPFLGLF